VATVNYYRKFLLFVVAPLVVFAAVVIFYLLPRYFECCCFKHNSPQARARSTMKFWLIFLYMLFLIYPAISSVVLRLYVCKSIDDGWYLLTDLRISCYTDTWSLYAYASIAAIALYPVGIPAFFFVLLWRNSRAEGGGLSNERIKAQLGFLYAGYQQNLWWFELVDTFHKLFLTSVLAFFPKSSQLPIGMCIVIGYLIIHLRLNPYLRPSDDALHLLAQVELFMLLLAGYIFTYLQTNVYSSTDDLMISIALIIICIGFVIAFLWSAGVVGIQMLRNWIVERQTKKVAADQQPAVADIDAPSDDEDDGHDHEAPPASAKPAWNDNKEASKSKSHSKSESGSRSGSASGSDNDHDHDNDNDHDHDDEKEHKDDDNDGKRSPPRSPSRSSSSSSSRGSAAGASSVPPPLSQASLPSVLPAAGRRAQQLAPL
jgi:hypothetical protein